MNEMIEKAGGKNLFADKKTAYPRITQEELLAKQPEYLIIPSQNARVYNDLVAQFPALSQTPADANKQGVCGRAGSFLPPRSSYDGGFIGTYPDSPYSSHASTISG